jgi:hypothetical protein
LDEGRGDERLIPSQIKKRAGVMLVPKFKKREVERKGNKKTENLEKKLIEENLEDLVGTGGEEEE